jgi:site-specific recombinase XerD
MKGCRPFTNDEIAKVAQAFKGRYRLRDRAFFKLGLRTGFRVAELLSIRLGDVWAQGQVLDRLHVRRCNMKRNLEGRTVPLHMEAKIALAEWIQYYLGVLSAPEPDQPLFPGTFHSRKPMSRVAAWRVLKQAYHSAGLTGPGLATHSLRKTFAGRIYELLDRDLLRTQKALGHRSIASTTAYLAFAEHEVDEAILAG